MDRRAFQFHLPPELIAQHPLEERTEARLLVVSPSKGLVAHSQVKDLAMWLKPKTTLVANEVRVRRARLIIQRDSGGIGEVFIIKKRGANLFEALVRPGSKIHDGTTVSVLHPTSSKVVANLHIQSTLDDGVRVVAFEGSDIQWEDLDQMGSMPLPPYIRRPAEESDDLKYQTVFASSQGEAVAAPTAGLHFSKPLIGALQNQGHLWYPIVLNVGIGTFKPVVAENIEDHVMHEESFFIPEDSRAPLEITLRQRDPLLCVGTTSLRTLATAWDGVHLNRVGTSALFFHPHNPPTLPMALLTNFHLPESTLFILICSLLGTEQAQAIYQTAINAKYRFFSYGDAMLILES